MRLSRRSWDNNSRDWSFAFLGSSSPYGLLMSKKTPRHGEQFEAQFRASVPPCVEQIKLAAQSPAAFALPAVERFLEERLGEIPKPIKDALGRSRFHPKAPYDLQLKAPTAYPDGELTLFDHLGRPYSQTVRPLQIFALELKSTGEPRLAFDAVEPNQEKGLTAASAAGEVAGVVVEFRSVGEVWFIPIGGWIAFRADTDGKSLPLAVARRIGMQIHRDEERGTSRPYWRVADWLRACGAEIPEGGARKPRKPKPPAEAPPDPEPNEEDLRLPFSAVWP